MNFGLTGLEPLDLLIADYYPVFALLLLLVLAVLLVRALTRGGTALGDYLDQRGTFNLSISRRPRTRAAARRHLAAARHPAPRLSKVRALAVLGSVAIALTVLVTWFMFSLYLAFPTAR